MSFYMYIASSDSLHEENIYEGNTFKDFTIELWREIDLNNDKGEWLVSITEIFLETKEKKYEELVKSCVVLSDLVQECYFNAQTAPVLRYISGSDATGFSLFQPYYVSLSKTQIKRIRIYLKNITLGELDLKNWSEVKALRCTLHFMKV